MKDFLTRTWLGLQWSSWIPLDADSPAYQKHIPTKAGIYRVRIAGQEKLAYIGQTGRDLRERLRDLSRNTYRPKETPPWNDPHTGAPGLWAWRIEADYTYEASVTLLHLSKEERECFEDMLLFRYRQEEGESTLCNHGRFHPCWIRPSNRKNGRAMQRLPQGQHNPAGGPSLPPVQIHETPNAGRWLGLAWSPNQHLSKGTKFPSEAGIYRLFYQGEVAYLGQSSSLQKRLSQHAQRFDGLGILVSYVEMPQCFTHHLFERETDVIGAFYAQKQHPPLFQYGQR